MAIIRLHSSLRMNNRRPRLNNKTRFRFTTFISIRQLINTINLCPRSQTIKNRLRRNRTMTRLHNNNKHRRTLTRRTSFNNGHQINRTLRMITNLNLRITLRNTNNKRIRAIRIVRQTIRRQDRTATHGTSTFINFGQLSNQLLCPITMNSFTNRYHNNRNQIRRNILYRRTSVTIDRVNRINLTLNRMVQQPTLNGRRQRCLTRNRTTLNRTLQITNLTNRNLISLNRINTMPRTRTLNRTVSFTVTESNQRQRTIRMIARSILPNLRNLQTILVNTRTNKGRLPGLFTAKSNRTVQQITMLFRLNNRNATTNNLSKRIRRLNRLQPNHLNRAQPISNKINLKFLKIRRIAIFSRRRTVNSR